MTIEQIWISSQHMASQASWLLHCIMGKPNTITAYYLLRFCFTETLILHKAARYTRQASQLLQFLFLELEVTYQRGNVKRVNTCNVYYIYTII